jgi:uncharacterized membrane protein
MDYVVIKWAHIVSSTLLFGTGLGSAYYMFFSSLSRDPQVVAATVRYVVIADWLFTTPTIILQPLTGLYLLHRLGLPLTTPWIKWSIALYFLAGAAWLPVVYMQIRMRDMARRAADSGAALPAKYWRYLQIWTLLGVVAFASLLIVYFLMVAKPQ